MSTVRDFSAALAFSAFGLAIILFGRTVPHTPHNLGVEAYPDEIEHPESQIPEDGDQPAEYTFARLRYPSTYGRFGRGYYSWGIDSPKADRQFVQGVRRLTRIDTRSVEEVVNIDSDEVYNWPWIYAVEAGHWTLSDAECAKLRDYLLRGGFLMTDDFHGTQEWSVFMASMGRVFPDRPVVDIPNSDPIFHVLYDLDQRFQVPGIQYWYTGRIYEKDGVEPHWRGIYDDRGRLMVGICHNQDNGDAWEWADHPRYPEKYASQAYRLGINFIVYAMTH
jgi:hypothetical protein